jgi:DNA-binding CsgD family transcriptional regulator
VNAKKTGINMKGNTDLSLQRVPARLPAVVPDYLQLLNRHYDFQGVEPDRLDKQLALIRAMAQLSSSGVTVYDLQKQTHIYASRNFYKLYGYDVGDRQQPVDNAVFDQKIHPDDRQVLSFNGYEAMKFMMQQPADSRKQFKMVTEYRIDAGAQGYVRVSEQHQVLEQDALGNIWLSLAVIDISPDQSVNAGVKCQIVNFHTGDLILLRPEAGESAVRLTGRETEILKMIGAGKLSKEISGMLDISIHTVNTHRQRILEKLQADNSIEALHSARQLGLIT